MGDRDEYNFIRRPRTPSYSSSEPSSEPSSQEEINNRPRTPLRNEEETTLGPNEFCANLTINTGSHIENYNNVHISKLTYYCFHDFIHHYTYSLRRQGTTSFPSNREQEHIYSPHPFEIYIEGRNDPILVSDGENINDFTSDMMKNIMAEVDLVYDRCVEITLKRSSQITGGGRKKRQKHRISSSKNPKEKQRKTVKKRAFPKRIALYSSPKRAQYMAHKYLGKSAKLYPARNPAKKYSIYDPKNGKWVNFGQMGYEDFTKHHNKTRRKNYLTRTKFMRGDWKKNPYSANNLSRNILW